MDVNINEIVVGGTYRHFKGRLYNVLTIASDSENELKKVVVYEAQYGNKQLWVRDYDMFLSPVDKDKYPEIKQDNRFELIKPGIEPQNPVDLIDSYKRLKSQIITNGPENNGVIEFENSQRKIVVGGQYRHFKGQLYKILAVANDSETNNDDEPKKVVVYEAQYGDKQVWVRDYDMFLSEIDKNKYPEIDQKYRFQLVLTKEK